MINLIDASVEAQPSTVIDGAERFLSAIGGKWHSCGFSWETRNGQTYAINHRYASSGNPENFAGLREYHERLTAAGYKNSKLPRIEVLIPLDPDTRGICGTVFFEVKGTAVYTHPQRSGSVAFSLKGCAYGSLASLYASCTITPHLGVSQPVRAGRGRKKRILELATIVQGDHEEVAPDFPVRVPYVAGYYRRDGSPKIHVWTVA